MCGGGLSLSPFYYALALAFLCSALFCFASFFHFLDDNHTTSNRSRWHAHTHIPNIPTPHTTPTYYEKNSRRFWLKYA